MTKPTRQEKTQKRRIEIVEAACSCFIAKGFHQSSMRDIARVAGISLGNVYNHFDSKEALIYEIAKLEAEEIKDVINDLSESTPTPIKTIEKFALDYLAITSQPENVTLSAEITAEALRHADIASIFDNNRQSLLTNLVSTLQKAQQNSEIDHKLNTLDAANFILDAIEGLSYRLVLANQECDRSHQNALLNLIQKYLAK